MADGRNIVQRIVRLVFDRNAARKAQTDNQQAVSAMDRALGKLKSQALAVGAAFAAAFTLTKIIGGIKSAVREFVEADKVWNRLAGTLETLGIGFGSVEGSIKAAARAMQDTTTVGDEQFAETLQQLVLISGDFEASLRNVSVVADVAAGAQIDLRTAAQLVGRAMVGETGTLKRYGIIVEEGADAVETMRSQFAGLAQNEARTLGGQIQQLSNEWGDFKQTIGEALVDASGGVSIIDSLTGSLKSMGDWLTDNKSAISQWWSDVAFEWRKEILGVQRNWLRMQLIVAGAGRNFRGIVEIKEQLAAINTELAELEKAVGMIRLPGETDIAGDIARLDARRGGRGDETGDVLTAEEIEKARQKEIQLLVEGAKVRQLTTAEVVKLLQWERDLRAELSAGIPDLERRLQIAKELAAVSQAVSPLESERRGFSLLRGPVSSVGQREGSIGLPPSDLARFDEHQERHRQWAEALLDDLARIERAQQQTWQRAGFAVEGFFHGLVEGSRGIGELVTAGLLGGFADYLRVKGSAALIEGAFPPNPALIAKGFALHALAGVVGGLQSRLASGGGGASISAGGGSLGPSRSALNQPAPDITLILQGDFDALNPKFVRAVNTATGEGIETIGNGRVRLQTTGGR